MLDPTIYYANICATVMRQVTIHQNLLLLLHLNLVVTIMVGHKMGISKCYLLLKVFLRKLTNNEHELHLKLR